MSVSTGFSFLMNHSHLKHKNRFLVSVSCEESVRQSIFLILSTQRGERPLYPNYGAQLRQFMFRKIDESLKTAIIQDVFSSLSLSEPRIKVESVMIEQDDKSRSRLGIVIHYFVKETMSKQSLVYPLEVFE